MMMHELSVYEDQKRLDSKARLQKTKKKDPIRRQISSKFFERIENQLTEQKHRREEMKSLQIDQIDSMCPFTPAISNHSRMISRRQNKLPLYERYDQEIKEQNQRLSSLRKSEQKRRSTEVKKRRHLVDKRRKKNLGKDYRSRSKRRDVYKENAEWYELKMRKIGDKKLRKLNREVFDKNLTFKPRINNSSRSILKEMSFDQRQSYYQNKRRRNGEKVANSREKYTFKPNLNRRSLRISSSRKVQEKRERSKQRYRRVGTDGVAVEFTTSRVNIKKRDRVLGGFPYNHVGSYRGSQRGSQRGVDSERELSPQQQLEFKKSQSRRGQRSSSKKTLRSRSNRGVGQRLARSRSTRRAQEAKRRYPSRDLHRSNQAAARTLNNGRANINGSQYSKRSRKGTSRRGFSTSGAKHQYFDLEDDEPIGAYEDELYHKEGGYGGLGDEFDNEKLHRTEKKKPVKNYYQEAMDVTNSGRKPARKTTKGRGRRVRGFDAGDSFEEYEMELEEEEEEDSDYDEEEDEDFDSVEFGVHPNNILEISPSKNWRDDRKMIEDSVRRLYPNPNDPFGFTRVVAMSPERRDLPAVTAREKVPRRKVKIKKKRRRMGKGFVGGFSRASGRARKVKRSRPGKTYQAEV